MSQQIFVSYRRSDRPRDAQYLVALLDLHFGENTAFLDTQQAPGTRWPDGLRSAVESARVLIVLIGPNWLDSRLFDRDDWVRQEIEIGIDHGLVVVPVTVGGADLPSKDELPASIHPLLEFQSANLQDERFAQDVKVMARSWDNLVSRSGARSEVERHQNATRRIASQFDWWSSPISISVQLDSSREPDARKMIQSWITSGHPHNCVVLGEPGSGKTGLLWWAAAALAQQDGILPVFIAASKLRSRQPLVTADLGELSTPPLDLPRVLSSSSELMLYVVLDGLDELVGTETGGEETANLILQQVISILPSGGRVLAACRTPTFELLQETLHDGLSGIPEDRWPTDPYARALERTLGTREHRLLVLRVAPVGPEEASDYLESQGMGSAEVSFATNSHVLRPFLTTPFSLRMLSVAFQQVVRRDTVAIDELYRLYVEVLLARTFEDRDVPGGIQSVVRALQRAATRGVGLSEDVVRISLAAGLLTRQGRELGFAHHSLFEYFFSSSLLDDLRRFDCELLSRLDLVGAYNINRMLVPMVLRVISDAEAARGRATAMVAPETYQSFLRSTLWRADTGYGLHPSITQSPDGVNSSSFEIDYHDALKIHSSGNHGEGGDVTCSISWYDAAAYALWSQTRLPTVAELTDLHDGGDWLVWCVDWYDEQASQVAVFESATGQIKGLNPDVRLPRTALAVVR